MEILVCLSEAEQEEAEEEDRKAKELAVANGVDSGAGSLLQLPVPKFPAAALLSEVRYVYSSPPPLISFPGLPSLPPSSPHTPPSSFDPH